MNKENLSADIVVIGGGGTGLAAAVAAVEKGASVILLEKRPNTGGTSVCASGLMAAESPAQHRMGIAAFKDEVFKVAMEYSHWSINPLIMRAFIEKSGDTIRWLESLGLQFTQVGSAFPGIDQRTFHSLGPLIVSGAVITRTLCERGEALGVRLFLHSPAKKILINSQGRVMGVMAELEGKILEIKTKSIIIATGGYSGNKELLRKYYPAYHENIQFLGLPHTGDGLLMAQEIGAASEGLGIMLLHPQLYRASVRIDALAQEPATVWVNQEGYRFADETITFRPIECANAVNRQPDKCIYILLDQNLKNQIEAAGYIKGGVHGKHVPTDVPLTSLEPDLQRETATGDVKISDSWDNISNWMGAGPEILQNTIKEYNYSCDQGYDATFNKDRRYLHPLRTPPYYAIRCYLSCLDTIGGIKINQHMEVLNQRYNPIPGLYAGGDVAGGWESETYCILVPGSALGFAINSGRIAAENAVNYLSRTKVDLAGK